MRKTSIICTLGPSSRTAAVLERMADAGMSVARVNCSHGTRAGNRFLLNLVDRLNRGRRKRVRKLLDLQGYRMRVRLPGNLREVALNRGDAVLLSAAGGARGTRGTLALTLDYPGSLGDVPVGSFVHVDDGNVALRVAKRRGDCLTARAVAPGIIKDGKGVNIPEAELAFGGLTDRDRRDLQSGLADEVDFVAQSFVRDADDMLLLEDFRRKRGLRFKLVAKIESRQGIRNLDRILKACDGIMVARGDLGVSVPVFQVPVLQKMIIAKCRGAGRFAVTATQMLESMTENPLPTRAEVSDVANAVIDGSDYVMLSAETAVGRHPVEVVRMMNQVVRFTEAYLRGDSKERSRLTVGAGTAGEGE
ncbi:MAG: pyruvate kinase [Candidatus Eisenbacteria bacterium]|nr:pyruvate kinase [Candidatus Eisenbacteria bacterium]